MHGNIKHPGKNGRGKAGWVAGGGGSLRHSPGNLWQHPTGSEDENTRSMKFKANEDINSFAPRAAPEETIKVQLYKDFPISEGNCGWKKKKEKQGRWEMEP